MTQTPLDLFLFEPIVPVDRDLPLEERFARFDAANPHVYMMIVEIARRRTKMGATRLSMKAIFEELRYERNTYLRRTEKYGLDNSFTALYARLVRDRESDLAGLFETRVRKAA